MKIIRAITSFITILVMVSLIALSSLLGSTKTLAHMGYIEASLNSEKDFLDEAGWRIKAPGRGFQYQWRHPISFHYSLHFLDRTNSYPYCCITGTLWRSICKRLSLR